MIMSRLRAEAQLQRAGFTLNRARHVLNEVGAEMYGNPPVRVYLGYGVTVEIAPYEGRVRGDLSSRARR